MVVSQARRRTTRQRSRRLAFNPDLEALETRSLPSGTAWPGLLQPLAEVEPNNTLDRAQILGDLTITPRAEVVGTITNGTAGADVDWYSFQLDRPANVRLSTPKLPGSRQAITTLSLYNSDPNDSNDPYDVLGHRLLQQSDSSTALGGVAQLQERLAPGTYFVAVSGSGNDYFNPFLAGSGYPGASGAYGLLLTASDLGLSANDGPTVLATDPAPGTTLSASPFLIRVDVSTPLDPNTVSTSTVTVLSNPAGTFGNGSDQAVSLSSVTLNTAGNELLIAPAAPLAPSFYKVLLAGNSSTNGTVLADPNGIPLGTNSRQPTGADFSYTFQINGNEGSTANPTAADDTPATAHDLGNLTHTNFVQVAGAIGDDATDPVPFDGSDVDLYHFRISGPARHAVTAEVFAGRIGSPLLAGVSLFRLDPSSGQLDLIGWNTGTFNTIQATDGSFPLLTDAALSAGLTAGDYYVAVSNQFNVPDPVNSPPGTNGVFDPTISHSGQNGGPVGNYVLNLQVQPPVNPVQVLAVTPSNATTLTAPPTQLTVQFSAPVNLTQLTLQSNGVNNVLGTLPAVYVQGSDGTQYYPRLVGYDARTNRATFLMLDGLGNGRYDFHLSGALGLTDLAGNPLPGNDPSGDYVVHFTVNGPVRGSAASPLLWLDQNTIHDQAHPQDLGVLFRHDMQAGVIITRDFSVNAGPAPADTGAAYRFQVLENQTYFFDFLSNNLPAGATASLFDATGNRVRVARQPGSPGFSADLSAGTYVLYLGDWQVRQAAGVSYTLSIQMGTTSDNPTPLTSGPAPAISIEPVTDLPPIPPPPLPSLNVAEAPPPPPSPILPPTPSVVVTPPAPVSDGIPTPNSGAPSTSPVQPVLSSSPAPRTVPGSPTGEPTLVLVATVPALPAASSGTPALVSTPVFVSGSSNFGITPAVLHSNGDRPAEAVTLPSGALVALGTTPVGVIKEPTPSDISIPADRGLVHLPDFNAPRTLPTSTNYVARVDSGTSTTDATVPTGPTHLETSSIDGPKPFSRLPVSLLPTPEPYAGPLTMLLSAGIHQLLTTSYKGALDAFFGVAQWFEAPALQPPSSYVLPEDHSTVEESVDFETGGSPLSLGALGAPAVANELLVNGLAVLGGAALALSTQRRKEPERRQLFESFSPSVRCPAWDDTEPATKKEMR